MGYPFQLPELGYATDALEPHIDGRTMEIHHGKHHQAYTNNLNAALEHHPELHGHSGEQLLGRLAELPEGIRAAVRNNGGGFVNHKLFWEIMAPGGANSPTEEISDLLSDSFGSFDEFKKKFLDEQEATNVADQTRISVGIHRAVQDVHARCLSSATAGEETGNDEELNTPST